MTDCSSVYTRGKAVRAEFKCAFYHFTVVMFAALTCERHHTFVRLTVGEVSRRRLSPSESRFTRLLLVTRLWGPPGPCGSSPAGHSDLSAGLRPFQSTALWEEGKEEKGQPRLSSAGSSPLSPPSIPGLSSPQSDPTELLNDSEEILRDDEDMVAVGKRRMVGMTVVRRVTLLQPVPYHVHLHAGDSSDGGGGDGMGGGGGVRSVSVFIYAYAVCACMSVCM